MVVENTTSADISNHISNGQTNGVTNDSIKTDTNGVEKCLKNGTNGHNIESIDFEPIDDETAKKIRDVFITDDPYVFAKPSNSVWPASLQGLSESILNFKVRKDDVWIVCYPRTGSTWTQELVWLLGNNLDYFEAMDIQQRRFPLLEFSTTLREGFIEEFE